MVSSDPFAHIEAVEAGTHQVTINDQPGCKVEKFFSPTAEVQGPAGLGRPPSPLPSR